MGVGNLVFHAHEQIGILTIDRPQQLNALNVELLEELASSIERFSREQELRALILTGAGEKAFIAGADIKEMAQMDPSQMSAFSTLGQRVTRLLEKAPFITLAAVNGFALGGGFEMALACDLIYAIDEAQFGLPEVSLGLIPGFGGTQRLAYAIGPYRARELIFSGRRLSAAETLSWGLINAIYPRRELISSCLDNARAILSHSFQAVLQARRAIAEGLSLSVDAGLELERTLFGVASRHPDRSEGLSAFLDKRSPEFN